jgi:hypothetical protein
LQFIANVASDEHIAKAQIRNERENPNSPNHGDTSEIQIKNSVLDHLTAIAQEATGSCEDNASRGFMLAYIENSHNTVGVDNPDRHLKLILNKNRNLMIVDDLRTAVLQHPDAINNDDFEGVERVLKGAIQLKSKLNLDIPFEETKELSYASRESYDFDTNTAISVFEGSSGSAEKFTERFVNSADWEEFADKYCSEDAKVMHDEVEELENQLGAIWETGDLQAKIDAKKTAFMPAMLEKYGIKVEDYTVKTSELR